MLALLSSYLTMMIHISFDDLTNSSQQVSFIFMYVVILYKMYSRMAMFEVYF